MNRFIARTHHPAVTCSEMCETESQEMRRIELWTGSLCPLCARSQTSRCSSAPLLIQPPSLRWFHRRRQGRLGCFCGSICERTCDRSNAHSAGTSMSAASSCICSCVRCSPLAVPVFTWNLRAWLSTIHFEHEFLFELILNISELELIWNSYSTVRLAQPKIEGFMGDHIYYKFHWSDLSSMSTNFPNQNSYFTLNTLFKFTWQISCFVLNYSFVKISIFHYEVPYAWLTCWN